jgi:glycosyltransferase involved in cell wall biosynthesis
VFPAEEDFGITVVEAQAAGAPVIAYGRGGTTETVMHGKTGILFAAQTVPALVDAIHQFEQTVTIAPAEIIRQYAENFSEVRFRQEFQRLLTDKWQQFQNRNPLLDTDD